MTHEDRQGGRVTRLLVPAGIAAALVAGAVAYAGPASADTPTASITLTAPAKVLNDSTPDAKGVVVVITNTSATASLTNTELDLKIAPSTTPANMPCDKITLTPSDASSPALTSVVNASTCEWTGAVPTIKAGKSATYTYDLAVDGQIPGSGTTPPSAYTGSLSSTAALYQLANGVYSSTLATSAAATTQLVGPSAPAFNATAPSPAIVHRDYSYQLMTDMGYASSSGTPSSTPKIVVYKQVKNSDGTETCTAQTPTTSGHDTVVALNDNLVYDETTGYIAASAADLTKTDSTPPTYVVVANNGVGGATTAVAATSTSCPKVALHDVQTSFSIPVLFGDTAVNSLFGPAIYKLADNGVISGYGDGNFHGQYAVTRDQFAAYISKYAYAAGFTPELHDGPCTTGDPSAFTDVPNSSLFCQDIKFLAEEGIVKGTGNDMFNPSGTILREQMAAFIYRAHQVLDLHVDPQNVIDPTCTSAPFTDVPTSNIFCGDIQWVATNHIAQGYGGGVFHPTYGVARQEAAQFISNLASFEDKL